MKEGIALLRKAGVSRVASLQRVSTTRVLGMLTRLPEDASTWPLPESRFISAWTSHSGRELLPSPGGGGAGTRRVATFRGTGHEAGSTTGCVPAGSGVDPRAG